jgi:hypothetical protein
MGHTLRVSVAAVGLLLGVVSAAAASSLPASEGPWRVVVPSEQRPARWIRQVVSFSIQNPPQEGKKQ